ncbi:MAG TPA: low molecular weight phosphatase family protein [Thermoplasmata archaeon]|jgi:protein-tyrosine-phosphatase
MTAPKVVLFICVGNSGRSLMAEAMFNANPPEGWTAISAGTSPAASVNPRTGSMLRELGLGLPPHPPQLLTPEMMDRARVRVTMGCLDDASCPARLKTLELRDWALPDPAHLDEGGFRQVRDRLAELVKGLRTELVITDRRRKGVAEDISARPA